MIENDTIELLKECNAGVKMGIAAIDEVLPDVEDNEFREKLETCMKEHEKLENETKNILNDYDDAGKEPNIMAKRYVVDEN